MKVRDRKKLQRLMIVQDVSHRELAEAVGWKSHSYVGRICRGQITNVQPEPALRMAKFFGVGVEDLFLTEVDNEHGRSVKQNHHAHGAPAVRDHSSRKAST